MADGGPAFPTAPNQTGGMSLRDYFAAHAPDPDPNLMYSVSQKDLPALLATLAWTAYQYADALLKARGK